MIAEATEAMAAAAGFHLPTALFFIGLAFAFLAGIAKSTSA
jgi:hypothetical protein